jgi:Family of unknown function (DUF6221)
VDAKRQILHRYQQAEFDADFNDDPDERSAWQEVVASLEQSVQVLAAVYTDHPDYREEWRP